MHRDLIGGVEGHQGQRHPRSEHFSGRGRIHPDVELRLRVVERVARHIYGTAHGVDHGDVAHYPRVQSERRRVGARAVGEPHTGSADAEITAPALRSGRIPFRQLQPPGTVDPDQAGKRRPLGGSSAAQVAGVKAARPRRPGRPQSRPVAAALPVADAVALQRQVPAGVIAVRPAGRHSVQSAAVDEVGVGGRVSQT